MMTTEQILQAALDAFRAMTPDQRKAAVDAAARRARQMTSEQKVDALRAALEAAGIEVVVEGHEVILSGGVWLVPHEDGWEARCAMYEIKPMFGITPHRALERLLLQIVTWPQWEEHYSEHRAAHRSASDALKAIQPRSKGGETA